MKISEQAYTALVPGDRVRAYGGLYIITVPAGVDGTSAWGKELRSVICGRCCWGDRCDDPTHFYRPGCPHCKGKGLVELLGAVRPIWRTDIKAEGGAA